MRAAPTARLFDTIERLSKLRAQYSIVGGGTGGRLSHLLDFGSNAGALGARTYVPADLPEGAPLGVVIHGCTRTAEGYDRGAGRFWPTGKGLRCSSRNSNASTTPT